MSDLDTKLKDAGKEQHATTDLAEVTALGEELVKRLGELDKLEQELKKKQLQVNEIQLDKLPAALKAANLAEFTLADGTHFLLKEDMSITIPKARRPEIIQRLREWNFHDIITNEVIVKLDKGQDNIASKIMEKADELGLSAHRQENVNSASVKKILNDRRKEGINDELAFFGAFLVTKVTVK